MYHNTTHLSGNAVASASVTAQNQEKVVLDLFNTIKKPMSAFEVFQRISGGNVVNPPMLTSIRRACSDLAKGENAKLEKTTIKVDGPYNRPVYLYRLKPTYTVGEQLSLL